MAGEQKLRWIFSTIFPLEEEKAKLQGNSHNLKLFLFQLQLTHNKLDPTATQPLKLAKWSFWSTTTLSSSGNNLPNPHGTSLQQTELRKRKTEKKWWVLKFIVNIYSNTNWFVLSDLPFCSFDSKTFPILSIFKTIQSTFFGGKYA